METALRGRQLWERWDVRKSLLTGAVGGTGGAAGLRASVS